MYINLIRAGRAARCSFMEASLYMPITFGGVKITYKKEICGARACQTIVSYRAASLRRSEAIYRALAGFNPAFV